MKGVSDYVMSDEYQKQKEKLFTNAYKATKMPTVSEYVSLTTWVLEQLVCIGGNRPCALLGITVKDWSNRKLGFCPFDQSEENEVIEEEVGVENRKILVNPFEKPTGSDSEEPTGVIVQTETDKVAVGPPAYIWFPNELVDIVEAHSLMASKFLPRGVDIYHPNTNLFLNSQGNPIKSIECKHFKEYLGIPIAAYDFRRSLSTFCLDNKNQIVREAEASVLRHSTQTAYSYYYQKHSDNVEYVNIQYAKEHNLIKASDDQVNTHLDKLKRSASNEQWELCQRRSDRAAEYSQELSERAKANKLGPKEKSGKSWVLNSEYDCFTDGIMVAIKDEEDRAKKGLPPGPYFQLLKYRPGFPGAGVFPPTSLWWVDMCRVLFGLQGTAGEKMRECEMSVYHGVPFAAITGRKKVQQELEKGKQNEEYFVVAQYWRDKMRDEAKRIVNNNCHDLRFIFSSKDLSYYNNPK